MRYIAATAACLALLVLLAACGSQPPVAHNLPPAITPTATPDPVRDYPKTMVANPRTAATDFQAGVTLLLYGNDVSYQLESLPVLNRLAADGANSLDITFPIYQSSWSSTDIHADPVQTPSDVELAFIIQEAKARGFWVMLRPALDEASVGPLPHWRGNISPTNAIAWMANYSDLMANYATLASSSGADALDIGTELNSMEPYSAAWSGLITRVHTAFSGQTTYSSNWNGPRLAAAIASQLDFISVDAYYPLAVPASASAAQVTSAWRSGGLTDLQARARAAGKPVVVTEIGVIPYDGIFAKPWSWTATGGYDPSVQATFYTGTCSALKPAIAGIYWWNVGLVQPTAPNGGFDPLALAATEQAMEGCYNS